MAISPIAAYADSPMADSGLSEEASIIRKMIEEVAKFQPSIALGEPRSRLEEDLVDVYREAQINDWDREGACRVEPSTFKYADQFLKLLPNSTPLPNILADTDGEILFEWDQGPRFVFSVSVGVDGTLAFAGLFGHEKIHGIKSIEGALPKAIAESIGKFTRTPNKKFVS
jgi:hypothetical protein